MWGILKMWAERSKVGILYHISKGGRFWFGVILILIPVIAYANDVQFWLSRY
jgi:hypothetical protein